MVDAWKTEWIKINIEIMMSEWQSVSFCSIGKVSKTVIGLDGETETKENDREMNAI